MRYSISWTYEGGQHYAHTDAQITATMVARAVSVNLATRVVVYSGTSEVIAYRSGEIVS